MQCTICKTNKVDGRKETVCPSCIEKEKSERLTNAQHDNQIRTEISNIVSEVITPEVIEEATSRIQSHTLAQIIENAIAYEILSSGAGAKYYNNQITKNILDAFILSKDLKMPYNAKSGENVLFFLNRKIEMLKKR